MPKSKISSEKATKNITLQMIGLTRSSSQEVADGYGPSIQKAELFGRRQKPEVSDGLYTRHHRTGNYQSGRA
jgi:hypothetical protein